MSTRVRFAPSPTGHLHVGNVRTAVFNYLFAKKTGGTFILRIEDTDLERSTLESETLIYEDLEWLGIKWDEGPSVGGDYGPYRQMERVNIYNDYAKKLVEQGAAYECFCTKEELDAKREEAAKEGKTFIYDRKCLHLSKEEKEALSAKGLKPSIRFKVSLDYVDVDDMIKGGIKFPTDTFGDFIIMRSDGTPIYNYVVVIDDALMKITHVIRGDDHLSNTPKQVLLYSALGFDVPVFAHIPMILGSDHSKLSKRHGDTSVNLFKSKGYLPDAMFNFLSLLSWSDPEEREILSKEELFNIFSLERVSKSPAVFDFEKLKWMNGVYIRGKSAEEIGEYCREILMLSNLIDEKYFADNYERYIGIISIIKDRMELLNDAVGLFEPFVKFNISFSDEDVELMKADTSLSVVNCFKESITGIDVVDIESYKLITKKIQKDTGAKGKNLFMVLRLALTGRSKGPDLDKFVSLMPVSSLMERLDETVLFMEKL